MKPHQIIEEIEALSAHYMRPVRTSEEHGRWLQDYVDDLKSAPDHALRLACKSWRSNPANTKMATPGQLALLAKQFLVEKRGEDEAFKPWRPLEDAEYARLSLREKIRHQLILASEARTKAGPMWLNNAPCAVEGLPPARREAWLTWTAEASRHAAEATRLQRFAKRQDVSA